MRHRQKWLALAPTGLATIGFGLSVLGNSIERKADGHSWFIRATAALCLVNAGVCLFGDAVKERTLFELGQT